MAAVIPTKEPESIVAGDTLKFDITLADYPAGDGWTLNYNLVNKDGSYPFSSTANGDSHRVNVPTGDTANWVAGFYALTGYVSNGTERYKVRDIPRIEILRDPSLTDGIDTRSVYQKILDLMEAALLSGASRQTSQVSAEGVTVTWRDSTDFLARLNWVKSQVNATNGKSKRILTRFSTPR